MARTAKAVHKLAKAAPATLTYTDQWFKYQCPSCENWMVWQDSKGNRYGDLSYVHYPNTTCRQHIVIKMELLKAIDDLTAHVLLVRGRSSTD